MKLFKLNNIKKLIIQYKFILFFSFITLICLILGLFLFRNDNLKPEHIKNGSNICICMWYDDGVRDYSDITKEINKKYCNLHKYDFIYDNIRRLPDRKPHWECIPSLLNVMIQHKYDYVIWIDGDACFRLEHDKDSLKEIINKYKDKDIIFSDDISEYYSVNTGFMIFKNNEYTKKILNNILHSNIPECEKYIDGPKWSLPGENDCIDYLCKNNTYDVKDRSVILPYGELQSFNIDDYKNSLIIHLAGRDKKTRIDFFNNYKNVNLLGL